MNFARDNKIPAKFLRKLPALSNSVDAMFSSAFYAKKLIPKELPFFYNNIAVLFRDAVRTTSENARLFEPSGEFRALKNKSGTSCIEK